MKLKVFLDHESRCDVEREWRCWYAWRPVRTGPRELTWLEVVERRNLYWPNLKYIEYRCVPRERAS